MEAKALPNGKAEQVVKFILENVITRHRAPKYLLSDREVTFRSELVTELLKLMSVTSQFTTKSTNFEDNFKLRERALTARAIAIANIHNKQIKDKERFDQSFN